MGTWCCEPIAPQTLMEHKGLPARLCRCRNFGLTLSHQMTVLHTLACSTSVEQEGWPARMPRCCNLPDCDDRRWRFDE